MSASPFRNLPTGITREEFLNLSYDEQLLWVKMLAYKENRTIPEDLRKRTLGGYDGPTLASPGPDEEGYRGLAI
jgi:hypothetical protein